MDDEAHMMDDEHAHKRKHQHQVQCSASCGKWFDDFGGLKMHWKKVPACDQARSKAAPTWNTVAARASYACSASSSTDWSHLFRQGQRRDIALEMTTDCRLTMHLPDVQVQAIKDKIANDIMPLVRQQLMAKLTPRCSGWSAGFLERTILECTDIFEGLRTQSEEKTMLREHLSKFLLKPYKRILGTRKTTSVDAENFAVGPVREVKDYCFDVLIEKSIERLLLNVPRALNEVLSHERRMHERANKKTRVGEMEDSILSDVCDGLMYRAHPELGDLARKERPTFQPGAEYPDRMVLSLGGYYDDVEPHNPIGHAKVMKMVGCFYATLLDLEPGTRNNLLFIMPHTFAYAKDVTRYGKKVLVGDPSSADWGKLPEDGGCTSFGASMDRLDRGREFEYIHRAQLRKTRMHGYLHLFSGDQPAEAKMGPWKRSVSARFPCRRTMLDQNDPNWRGPSSYLDSNVELAQKWPLRTEEQLWEQELEYERLAKHRPPKTAAKCIEEALEYLTSIGINKIFKFDSGLKHFKHFKITSGQVQDLMHNLLHGGATLELAAFIFLCIRHKIFTLEQFNNALRSVDWTKGERPPDLKEIEVSEGQAGNLPKTDCHVSWTASQMLHFLPRSIEVLENLFKRGLDLQRQELEKISQTTKTGQTKRKKMEEVLEDVERAWASWQALVAMTDLALSHSLTISAVAKLDRLIWDHDVAFLSVNAYIEAGLWKPKHNFMQLLPLEFLHYGPARNFWCMRYEAMNKARLH